MGKDDLQVKGKRYYESIVHGVKSEKLYWSKVNFRKSFFYSSGCLVVVPEEAVVALLWQHLKNNFDEHRSETGWSWPGLRVAERSSCPLRSTPEHQIRDLGPLLELKDWVRKLRLLEFRINGPFLMSASNSCCSCNLLLAREHASERCSCDPANLSGDSLQ